MYLVQNIFISILFSNYPDSNRKLTGYFNLLRMHFYKLAKTRAVELFFASTLIMIPDPFPQFLVTDFLSIHQDSCAVNL